MFCKIFPTCSLYICLVLLLATYSEASSIYRQNKHLNSILNTLDSTNSKGELDRTESITSFSLNNEDAQADCKCRNGLCVNNVCTCPSGWGLYYSYDCHECGCGKGINCTFDKELFRNKYCLCPDGYTRKNEACKDNCVNDPCKNGGTCFNVKGGYACNCPAGYEGKNCETRNNTCENFGNEECDEKGKYCIDDENFYKCGDCKSGYKVSSNAEICVLETCENGGAEICMESGMTCITKLNTEDGLGYVCGRCLDNYRRSYTNNETCLPDTCDNFGNDHCLKRDMTCKDIEGSLGYICDECIQYFRRANSTLVYCVEETCESFGVDECRELGRLCVGRENGVGFTCGDCMENFQEENCKCVAKTCAVEGESECKKVNRMCVDQYPAGYICGECGHGFTEIEGSNICTEDFCLSSPCKNNGICKVENGSFVCFCKHPFFGETCEVEINPTTSSPLNISTSMPDWKTTSNNSIWTTPERFNWTTYLTTKPSNYSRDYNLTTVELHSTPTPITVSPNITLVDFLTTKPTNYSWEYNLTTTEVRSTPLSTTSITVNTTTILPVNKTTIDTTATTVTVGTTPTSSEKPSTSDRGVKVIFRNDYTIRNLTEVIIKM